ncbi:glycosyltransferase family 2 protein [bacterium]|nr:glycosyltransferase family 2 protein [bacterium]
MADLIPVSVVVLTRNEAERIERCLSSLKDFKQVIVLDSLSCDCTLERAREVWADLDQDPSRLVLLSRDWPGFTKARNESLNWVHENWVVWIDADEWISEELANSLRSFDKQQAKVLLLDRQSYFLGHRVKHGGWYPDRKRRVAPAGEAVWMSGPRSADVHEDLYLKNDLKSEPQLLQGTLFHEPFRNEEEQIETNQEYSSLLAVGVAEGWREKGRKAPSNLFIALKGVIKFVENFIFKLGILDGWVGYKIAKGSAQSMMWRLEKAKKIMIQEKTQ